MKRIIVLAFLCSLIAAAAVAAEGDFQKSPVKQFTKTETGAAPADSEAKSKAPDLDTAYYKVKNYQASFLGETVRLMLSDDGILQANDDLSILIITDHKTNLDAIKKMLEDVDTLPEQIVIEAKVLEVRNDFSKDAGINLASVFQHTESRLERNRSAIDDKQAAQLESSTGNSSDQENNGSTMRKSITGALSTRYSQMSDLINFMVENGYGRIVAEPRIVTVNNKTGRVFIGNRIKFSGALYDYNASTYRATGKNDGDEAGIILEVTPHIGNGDFITMDIKTGFGQVTSLSGASSNVFVREANSTVIVKSGEPFVIGGYTTQEESVVKYKFPVLGELPLLKNFFTKKERSTVDVELMMVLTPRIVKPGEGAPDMKITEEYENQ